MTAIVKYMVKADGTRNCGFRFNGCDVLVGGEGSAVAARILAGGLPESDEFDDLNALPKVKNAATPFCGGVIRTRDGGGHVYLMNKQEKGWSSSCREHRDIADLVSHYCIRLTERGRDEFSAFVRFEITGGAS